MEEKDIIKERAKELQNLLKDVIVETIEELQSLLREGDKLTITPKSARLVHWGKVRALGTEVAAVFLAREG